MNINLNPRLKNLIQQQMDSGKYISIDNILEEALILLEKRNQYDQWVEEIGQKIDVAAQQLDRGEGIDGEIAINQLREQLQHNKQVQ